MDNFQTNFTPLNKELSYNKLDEIEKEMVIEDKKTEKYKLIALDELLNTKFSPIAWAVEKLIPVETITFLSGSPASFKTWTILELAIKVSTGGLLFNKFKTSQTSVLIIDEENGTRLLKDRLSKIPSAKSLPVYFLSCSMFTITPESIKKLIETAKEKNIGMIIFDSFVRVHGASDENDAVKISQVFKLTKQLTKNGLTIVFTHHNRKESFTRKSNP
ncbi:MAG: AAA family ATPase, partial [Candidatus Taylorbacteria bacterium]|nr:AAA family ATPase [Candidatus Taylorbacteria bacterium]